MKTLNNYYKLLPFRFKRFGEYVLLTNEVGDYYFLSDRDFESFIDRTFDKNCADFLNLKAKNFLYNHSLPKIIDHLSTKYRTKNKFLYDFTSLHMFVITRRCNQRCDYCHASSISDTSHNSNDMNKNTARKSVELALQSPAKTIKIEFQGGEPLLNFDILKDIVEYAHKINESKKKKLEFVICTNLVGLKTEYIDFFKTENIMVSTSLDGPKDIHDSCRKLRNGKGSYDAVVSNLQWLQEEIGFDNISALMTVTPYNLNRLKEVVDEYLSHNLQSIFIRRMNPFGYAYERRENIFYEIEEFLVSYKYALDYIIKINRDGTHFPEVMAEILLSRILTPFSTGFVDLQSPAGTGISGVVYDIDGSVFVSDEARMLFRTTADRRFCIGNVHSNSWKEIFCSSNLKDIISNSCIDSIPGCSWCAYKPYCGGDPVKNFFLQGDMVGHRATNDFCKEHMSLFDKLFDCLRNGNGEVEDVFWSWITHRSLDEIKNFSGQTHIEEYS